MASFERELANGVEIVVWTATQKGKPLIGIEIKRASLRNDAKKFQTVPRSSRAFCDSQRCVLYDSCKIDNNLRENLGVRFKHSNEGNPVKIIHLPCSSNILEEAGIEEARFNGFSVEFYDNPPTRSPLGRSDASVGANIGVGRVDTPEYN